MLFKIRQLLDKNSGLLAKLMVVSALFMSISPVVGAIAQHSQQSLSNNILYLSTVDILTAKTAHNHPSSYDTHAVENKNPTNYNATNINTAPHCLSMEQSENCDNIVCCPTLVNTIPMIHVHPIVETHKSLVTDRNYHVTLATEIKPPILLNS